MTRILAIAALLTGCGCPTAYRYDGGVTARPYYKVELCPNRPPRVLCDDVEKLPTARCR